MPRGKTIPNLRQALAEEANANGELQDRVTAQRSMIDTLVQERDFYKKIIACLMEVIRAEHS